MRLRNANANANATANAADGAEFVAF